MTLLNIEDLKVTFKTADGEVNAVNGVSFGIDAGETLAIVGESGSGKSQTAFATMGILAQNGRATGRAMFDGKDLLTMKRRDLNKIRSQDIAMIFQDPMTSLNPYLRISDQMAEVLQIHKGMSKRDAVAESAKMLDAVKIPDANNRITMYPHEFSGGMRQRIMIAMSLLCQPKLLIADEPTTALDVTVQAQIMQLFDDIRADFGTAVILITHDLGVVAGIADRVMVMYGGQVVEHAAVKELFRSPRHPYTRALMETIPALEGERPDRLLSISGTPPTLNAKPTSCPFAPRCAHAFDRCRQENPQIRQVAEGHDVACWWDSETGVAANAA